MTTSLKTVKGFSENLTNSDQSFSSYFFISCIHNQILHSLLESDITPIRDIKYPTSIKGVYGTL